MEPSTLHAHDFDGICPICGSSMAVTRLGCPSCGSALEGVFHLTVASHHHADPDGTGAPPRAETLRAERQGDERARIERLVAERLGDERARVERLAAERLGEERARIERFGRLTRLDDAQLQFVEAFLRCRGVIKNVEDMLGISYPTVRARLASVLETMGFGPEGEQPAAEQRQARREILADLAAGRISTEEAHRLLGRAGTDEQ